MIEHIPPGYTPLDELPKFTWVAMLNLLGQGTDVKILEAHGQVSDLGIDVLVDVSWEETHGSGKDQRTVTIYRTLAFMHRPEFKLPRFEMTNAEGFFSSWVHKGSGTMEMVKLPFPDRPDLNKRYSIASPVPASCGLLFSDIVLDQLEKHEGLDGIGNHNGIMTWRNDDALLKGPKRSQLAVDSKAIFTSVVDDAEAGQRIAAAMPGSYAEELVTRLEADGSKQAQKLLDQMVRREQVDHLASQAPPRAPHRSIVKRTLGMNGIIIMAGVLMAGIGLPISITGMVLYPLFKWPDWWISLAIIVVGVAGVLMIAYSIRWRRRRLFLLTRGQWIDAQIQEVKATNSTSNKEILHQIHFKGIGRDDVNIKLSLGTHPSRIARQMMYQQDETRILVDPDHHDRGLWLEGWVVENIPD